jgi:hypothetical protein
MSEFGTSQPWQLPQRTAGYGSKADAGAQPLAGCQSELSEKAPGVWLGSQILGVRATRQAQREYRALALLARDRHVAAHHACELA